MTQENEFIAALRAARERAVQQRRDVIKALSGPFERGETERMRELLTSISGTISLIDEALLDEQRIEVSRTHRPVSVSGPSKPGT